LNNVHFDACVDNLKLNQNHQSINMTLSTEEVLWKIGLSIYWRKLAA